MLEGFWWCYTLYKALNLIPKSWKGIYSNVALYIRIFTVISVEKNVKERGLEKIYHGWQAVKAMNFSPQRLEMITKDHTASGIEN